MKTFKWQLLFLPFFSVIAEAQLTYTFENSVSFIEEQVVLSQPFSGGFIAPQYSTIDLNLDGTDDLFVFDRASNKIFTYLLEDGQYTYSPFYESLFPAGLQNWVLLRDYNCDGKMDLFTSSIFGISLYENTSTAQLEWELIHQTIYTEGFSGQINLQVNSSDLPAITDVDNDGDLDILTFNFSIGGTIEFHKNLSVENSGACGLEFNRVTRRYGDFEECTCDTYTFGTDDCPTTGRIAHSGGRAILSFNYSTQALQDLLIGQEYCNLSGYLPNTGTISDAKMESVSFDFPNLTDPLRINFPAFYEVDIFNDGVQDLLVAPNNYQADGLNNYDEFYQYTKNDNGEYDFVTNQFLKNEMIDVGHKASPVFVDLDFDGDEDLLIGTGTVDGASSIWMYENTGTIAQPSFELVTRDYLEISVENNESIKLQVFDIEGNNLDDLILYKIKDNLLEATAFLYSANPVIPYSKSNSVKLVLPELSIWDNPTYFKRGVETGLLIGKQAGNLEYYTTTSSVTNASWQLVSAEYLSIAENFNNRNLHTIIEDINANGTNDLLTLDDRGVIMFYENFLEGSTANPVMGITELGGSSFSLNFGRITQFSLANLFATKEPAICVGLLTGGLQLLKNSQSTNHESGLELMVITFPNPVESNQITIQSNKNGRARVIDVTGKVIIDSVLLQAGLKEKLQLPLLAGVYLVEVVSNDNQKRVKRIVVTN
ncbi:MAG: T9SS type A sorting domain-containing protein [Cyclobacteriaceae bacterium]|nr:T9SS type A sorting domain-containing protein [Cyclobacteriaceae bacterium]